MKLYYHGGSCSTSCHITLQESGLKYDAVAVDLDNNSDPNVAETARLNPLGTLPVMTLDNGKVLSQNLAIHTYVADLAPEKKLLPALGTFERAETMNWLSFVAADLHKAFVPVFVSSSVSTDPKIQGAFRDWGVKNVNDYLGYLDKGLAGKDYLTGKNFTVADAYCFVVLGWTKFTDIPLDPYKNVSAYVDRVYKRPAVQHVLKVEGLLE
jgi:glutathione S-transferase